MKKAIILLSGGLDSATVAAIAIQSGYELYALSFDYGQRHKIELESAKKIVNFFKIKEHKIATIDLRIFGGSALTAEIAVPKITPKINPKIVPNTKSKIDDKATTNSIPVTYVPARNTIFLSYCLGYAEIVGATNIFIGVNAVDYSGYPDCRPEFIKAFEEMANLATARSVSRFVDGNEMAGEKLKIQTPLISLSKKEIIKAGVDLGVDYSITTSCYDPTIKEQIVIACGVCESCQFRLKGFAENGIADPHPYLTALENS
jgi:7-cyano-7-deazaguanine synthase